MGLRLCCLAVLLLASAGCDQTGHAKKPVSETRVLADGGGPAPLPSVLRRFHGQAVVGARELRARVALRACPIDRRSLAKSRFSQAWVSTDGLTVEFKLKRASVLIACDAVRDGNRWVPCAQRDTRSGDPRRVELAGGSLDVTCQGPTRMEAMWVAVPRAAIWTLVDERTFWVAYRSAHRPLIRITNRGSSGRFRVAFLDRQTRVLSERQIMGYVAG